MLTFVHPKQHEMDSALITDYGLGMMEINPQLTAGQRARGHLGSIPGYRAFVGHFPDHGFTVALLYNSDKDDCVPMLEGLIGVVLRNLREEP